MHDWLTDQLVAALRWQVANPGAGIHSGPEIPLAGYRVWQIFNDLHSTRAVGMAPCAITYVEIEAWARLHREPVRPFEVEIINTMDRAYLEALAGRQPGDAAAGHPSVSARPMSAGMFDAVFP